MLFFAEYCAGILRIETLPSLQMSFLTMTVYLLDYIISSAFPAPYHLAYQVEFSLQIIWAIITFVITITCMQSFLWLTFSTETLLSKRAASDRLTGLNNRFFLSEYLHREEKESGLDGHWAAMMDIDDFKSINDTYGHVTGDYILKRVAEITTEVLNDCFVCRYGGEEFVVVLKPNEEHSFFERLEILRTRIAQEEFEFKGNKIHITITIGGATYSHDLTLEKWVEFADVKMYSGKNSGKNKTVISNTSL
jgi:diguanylate cyclase (GGDEF)-like protein